jgi:hypothetical protein
MNQQPPVPGRKWSAGDVNAVASTEFVGQWLFGALGAASHNTVPSTDNVLMAASELDSDTAELTLTTQPSDGGAVLQIPILGTPGSGTLEIRGTNTEGNAASETISWDSEAPSAVLYSRTSFSAVDSIAIQSLAVQAGASIQVNGIKNFEHTLFTATSNPTFAIERLGDPAAGAASQSFMHPGMVLQNQLGKATQPQHA